MKKVENDRFLNELKDIIQKIAVSLVLIIIITQFIARPVFVDGVSMQPTLEHGEYGISNVLSAKTSPVRRFEIIVLDLPTENKKIVKRVIGLPGETVEYKDDVLYINNQAVSEPFLDTDFVKRRSDTREFTVNFGPLIVPDDSYFVLGDNRPRSSDSRNFGSFSRSSIHSKSVWVFFPFNKMGHKK